MRTRKPKTIEIIIPDNWMNCAVTLDNNFIADTNNSRDWDIIKFPLPEPKHGWQIASHMIDRPKVVVLIDKK